MQIHPADSRPATPGNAAYFTGKVTLEPVIEAPEPARIRAARVTFQPGARTAWHTHPLGQTLIVVSGQGRAQSDGGPVQVLNPGDTVWFAPLERHWHGAAPDSAMCHIAIQEAQDGGAVTWAEQVDEAEYRTNPG